VCPTLLAPQWYIMVDRTAFMDWASSVVCLSFWGRTNRFFPLLPPSPVPPQLTHSHHTNESTWGHVPMSWYWQHDVLIVPWDCAAFLCFWRWWILIRRLHDITRQDCTYIVYTRNEVSDGRSSVYSRGGHDNVGAANLDHMWAKIFPNAQKRELELIELEIPRIAGDK
jgi:hypothetical protein